MFKTIFKVGIKLLIVLSFAICCGLFLSKVARPSTYQETDNTKEKVDGFYALEENSIDVLGLGTSHLYCALNPGALYYFTGLSLYDFAGQCQSMEVSYIYLLEALKTQSPKLVVVDLFGLSHEANQCQMNSSSRINIQDLKPGLNKLQAYTTLYDNDVLTNFFDLKLYADNLKDIKLSEIDKILNHDANFYFGYTPIYPSDFNIYSRDLVYASELVAPNERELQAFMAIIDLCKEKDIPLLVVKTPYFITQEDANIYAYVYDICDKQGVPYIDFNYMLNDIGYSYGLDGDSWHANVTGSYKITKYLSEYILQNYNLSASGKCDDKLQALYFETLQIIFKTVDSFELLRTYLDYYDVTALINDPKDLFGMGQAMIVYNKDLRYYDRFISNGTHNIEMLEDGSVYVDGKMLVQGYYQEVMVIVDNLSGKVVDIINIDERIAK